MYAIVDIAGKQFKVSKNDKILVPKLEGKVGKNVEFDKVLLLSDKGKITVGQPVIKGASVKAKILGFERGKKVTVFKKKRRKGYKVKSGHRQDYTELMIKGISSDKKTKEEK
ncbi:MAG: 50S ribosomal protein L21 [bacterium]